MDWVIVLVLLALIVIVVMYITLTRESEPESYFGFADEKERWIPPEIVNDILTQEDCKYLIEKATPLFHPSQVVGSSATDKASRTSETAWIDKDDPVARKVIEKAMQLTGKPIENCEKLQVVRYKPGTFYRNHHDACCDDDPGCGEFVKNGGQRVGTLLVYLNNEFTDGETHFPSFNDLKLKAPTGSAIFFRPLSDECGKCHPNALHAGLPISSGTKYVCNAWVRQGRFM